MFVPHRFLKFNFAFRRQGFRPQLFLYRTLHKSCAAWRCRDRQGRERGKSARGRRPGNSRENVCLPRYLTTAEPNSLRANFESWCCCTAATWMSAVRCVPGRTVRHQMPFRLLRRYRTISQVAKAELFGWCSRYNVHTSLPLTLCFVACVRVLQLVPSPDACYLSRHVALKVGVRVETPALTVNRLCGSGFETVIQVRLGEKSSYIAALAGGAATRRFIWRMHKHPEN